MSQVRWGGQAHHLNAGGKRLEYATYGEPKPNTPVFALLHEGLGCAALWRAFPQQIHDATGLAVFAYSRAGYGQSESADLPRPLDYMTREAVEVLPEVLDAVDADAVILLGHSDGATIAAEYAGRVADERLKGVILMAPHFFTEPMGLAEIAQAKTAFETTDLAVKMGKYHQDPENTFRGWNDAWLAPDFQKWNVASVIDEITVPILAIQGAEDQYGTCAQICVIKKRAKVPVDVAILYDCRHSPQFDQPRETLRAIANFAQTLNHPSKKKVVNS